VQVLPDPTSGHLASGSRVFASFRGFHPGHPGEGQLRPIRFHLAV
jgi:hypothetical protein